MEYDLDWLVSERDALQAELARIKNNLPLPISIKGREKELRDIEVLISRQRNPIASLSSTVGTGAGIPGKCSVSTYDLQLHLAKYISV
jgi:hypothetical protein